MICEQCGTRVPHHVPGDKGCKRRRLREPDESFKRVQDVFDSVAFKVDAARGIPYDYSVKEVKIDNVEALLEVYRVATQYVRWFEEWYDEHMEFEPEDASAYTPPCSTTPPGST